jgi:hypothetical protein
MTYTTPREMVTAINDYTTQYKSDDFAIITNWKNPYTNGIHGDWRRQVRNALSNPKHHIKLSNKLSIFKPFVLIYSKLEISKEEVLSMAGFQDATVCIICSSGEHLLTPWMIIHNIGHTAMSWNMWVKDGVMEAIGLTSHDDSIIPIQKELVDTAASREHLIPNLNELIYELFTTWVWWGETRSDHKKLREFCNKAFPKVMESYENKMFFHKYRRPVPEHEPQEWLEDILSSLDDEVNYVPGVPGFTTKVLKQQNSS